MKKAFLISGVLVMLAGCGELSASNDLTKEEQATFKEVGLIEYMRLEKRINELENKLFR